MFIYVIILTVSHYKATTRTKRDRKFIRYFSLPVECVEYSLSLQKPEWMQTCLSPDA